MPGRGRGKKKGYTPPSGAQLFLRRSLDECGLSGHTIRSVQDITRPALFPNIRLHSSGDQRMLVVEQQQQIQKEEEEKVAAAAAAAAAAEGAGGGAAAVKSEDITTPQTVGGDVGHTSPSTSSDPTSSVAATGTPSERTTPLRTIRRSAQTLALIGKSREMHHRIQNSVHYVRPTKDVPDVVRYSESNAHRMNAGAAVASSAGGSVSGGGDATAVDATAVLSACLGGRKRTRLGLYVPDELACGQRIGARARSASAGGLTDAMAAGKAVSLTELEEIERKRARAGSVGGPGGTGRNRATSAGNPGEAGVGAGGGDDLVEHAQEEEEEEEGEDYVMNYYESEGEEGSDGGAEPTF